MRRFLFAPAVALTARLRFAGKFALVGAVMALALGYFAVQASATLMSRLQQMTSEEAGVRLIGDLVAWNKALIEYRRIAITAPVGDVSVQERLKQQAAVNEQVLARLDADVQAAHASFDLAKGASGLRNGWNELHARVAALPLDAEFAQQAFSAHGKEFDRLYALMRDLGDVSGMSLEPDQDLFYLGFALANNTPKVAGITVRVLAYETLNLARGTLTMRDKVFYEVTDARLSDAFSLVETQLAQAMKVNELARSRLTGALANARTQSAELVHVARENFVNRDKLASPLPDVANVARPAVEAAWSLVSENAEVYRILLDERRHQARVRLAWSLGVAVAALLTVGWLFAGMYFSLGETIRELNEATAGMAQGDLRRRVHIQSKDELALVGTRFNDMATALTEVVTQVKRTAGLSLQASTTLSETAQQIARSSRVQSESAQSTVSSVEEVSVSISHVADNAGEAVTGSQATAAAADAGEQRMNAAVEEIRRVAASVERAAENISGFGARTQEIGAIVGTIKSISDRTNLLALNAAIEAARAGESGRGFAVVADEVRALAENTRQATDNIAAVIETVQQGVRNSIDEVRSGSQQVAEGVAMTVEASKSLEDIRASAIQSRGRVEEIAHATREQKTATEDIARNIERIALMAEENDRTIAGINEAAAQLKNIASELSASVDSFQV